MSAPLLSGYNRSIAMPAVRSTALLVLVALLVGAALISEPAKAAAPSTNFWAFQPIRRPSLPAVRYKEWPRTPVDFFILAGLEEKNLKPAPPADRATLLRRVTFDLHGLPPTPAELDDFVSDNSPDAFARVIDRLLASPRYGERWARHWLDVARFSESDGFEYDKMREHAWPYRDYVIKALNDDKPYARFVQEQIAGDALEPVTREGIAATGFLVAGPYDEAGNISASSLLKARVREEDMEDIIAAVSQTFLGLTVNCARCHDHKFDPIPQADYYRLKAALDGVRHGNRPAATPEETRTREQHREKLTLQLSELEKKVTGLEARARERFGRTNGSSSAAGPVPMARWTFEGDARDSIGGLHGTLQGGAEIVGGRLRLDGKGAFVRTEPLTRDLREKTLEAWVALGNTDQRGGGVIALETADQGEFDAIVFGERVPRRWMAGSSYFQRSRDLAAPNEKAEPGELIHVAIVYRGDHSITVFRNGVPYADTYTPDGPNATLRRYPAGATRVLLGLRHTGAGNGFLAGELEEARLYDRALSHEEIATSSRALRDRHPPLEDVVRNMRPHEREERTAMRDELGRLRRQLKAAAGEELIYAVVSRQPEPTFVLARGDVEQRRQPVVAGALSAVAALPSEFSMSAEMPEAARRLQLAEWVTNGENPLPWRVIVNRVWQHHFGQGVVATPNDFGVNGGRPSHPELLDWLASEFFAQSGSLKKLHRVILLSAAYRQGMSSKGEADPGLLVGFPLRRLEAEVVRDAMLAVSGQLNPQMGGLGFRPFKITVANSHFYELFDADGAEFNRRSIYRAGIQSAKDPLLDSLDCPDPSTKTPARSVTTTPIQALSLMNNAFAQRQGRHLAQRLASEAGSDTAAQIHLAYRLVFGRAPDRSEAEAATLHTRRHGLESLCWTLLNASEFLYVR